MCDTHTYTHTHTEPWTGGTDVWVSSVQQKHLPLPQRVDLTFLTVNSPHTDSLTSSAPKQEREMFASDMMLNV